MLKRTLSVVFAALLLPILALGGQGTPTAMPDYVLGPGDTITEYVVNHLEFSGDFVVPNGGVVVFPATGPKMIEGMTIQQLADYLTKSLKKELLKPRVSILLKTPRLQQVFVYGDVAKPGPVPLAPGLRLSDAFNSAGGLSADFKLEEAEITLLGRGGTKLTSALTDTLSNNGDDNPVLHDGDTVNIDAGWFLCYVVGMVKTPGAEHMKRGTGILQAISAAGGVVDPALTSAVRITRADKSEVTVDLVPELVRGEHLPLPDLMPGDVITIPQNQSTYSVLGYVNLPGPYPIPQGKTITLADAISQASGQDVMITHKAKLSVVKLDRTVDGKHQFMTYNVGKYLTKGDVTQNPTIQAGDVIYVPETEQVHPAVLAQILSGLGLFIFYGLK